MNVRQVLPWRQWPSGDSRPIAVLRPDPDELAGRYHLNFARYADDLDEFVLAAIEPAPEQQVWLQRYAHNPTPGTTVLADAAANPGAVLRQVTRALCLDELDITWVAPAPARLAGD